MPTYNYRCRVCGGVSERFQPITAKPSQRLRCGKCGKTTPVERLIGGGAGVIFKGSGFHQTDYRSESYRAGAEKDAEARKADETKESD